MINFIALLEHRISIRCNIYQVQSLASAIASHIDYIVKAGTPLDALGMQELETFRQLYAYTDRRFRTMYKAWAFSRKPVDSASKKSTLSLTLPRWMLLHQSLIFDEKDHHFDEVMFEIDQELQRYSKLVKLERKERIEALKKIKQLQ
jgi:hypothetical protein